MSKFYCSVYDFLDDTKFVEVTAFDEVKIHSEDGSVEFSPYLTVEDVNGFVEGGLWVELQITSKFYCGVYGFLDGTKFVEVKSNGEVFIHHSAKKPRLTTAYTPESVARLVANGSWIEVTGPSKFYAHYDGFHDGTKCVEIGPNGEFRIHTERGDVVDVPSMDPFAQMFVASGLWVEVSAP